MNENVTEFLFDSFCIVFFISAISLFLLFNNSTNANIKLVQNSVVQDKAMYESSFNPDNIKVSGSEILSKIYNGLEVDIIVNAYPISKGTDKNTFNYSVIDPTDFYKVHYNIDADGKVTTIIYTKL